MLAHLETLGPHPLQHPFPRPLFSGHRFSDALWHWHSHITPRPFQACTLLVWLL